MIPKLHWRIHKLAFLLEKRSDEDLKKQTSLGFAQYKVLEAIAQNSLAKQNAIAEQLDQTEASISRQIRILERKELIVVATVMGNKRARELALTETGEKTLQQCEQILHDIQTHVFGGLSEEELQTLQSFTDRIIKQLRTR